MPEKCDKTRERDIETKWARKKGGKIVRRRIVFGGIYPLLRVCVANSLATVSTVNGYNYGGRRYFRVGVVRLVERERWTCNYTRVSVIFVALIGTNLSAVLVAPRWKRNALQFPTLGTDYQRKEGEEEKGGKKNRQSSGISHRKQWCHSNAKVYCKKSTNVMRLQIRTPTNYSKGDDIVVNICKAIEKFLRSVWERVCGERSEDDRLLAGRSCRVLSAATNYRVSERLD